MHLLSSDNWDLPFGSIWDDGNLEESILSRTYFVFRCVSKFGDPPTPLNCPFERINWGLGSNSVESSSWLSSFAKNELPGWKNVTIKGVPCPIDFETYGFWAFFEVGRPPSWMVCCQWLAIWIAPFIDPQLQVGRPFSFNSSPPDQKEGLNFADWKRCSKSFELLCISSWAPYFFIFGRYFSVICRPYVMAVVNQKYGFPESMDAPEGQCLKRKGCFSAAKCVSRIFHDLTF